MKKVFLSLFAFWAFTGMAQEVIMSSPKQLLNGTTEESYYPVLSADGTNLLYTGNGYKGLKIYSFNDNTETVISDKTYAGYQPTFTAEGDVYYSTRNLSQFNSELYKYNIKSKINEEVLKDQRQVIAIRSLKKGVMVKTTETSKTTDKSAYVYTNGTSVIVGQNGVEKSYSPILPSAGYIWSSLSPDKTKVMFFAAGKGIVIMDLNGNVLKTLGNYECPVWYGNDYVVAQNAKDDGHQFISSQILLIKADGSKKYEVTASTSMTMHPTASAQSGRIVYDTIDGELYMVNVSIK